MKPVFKSLLLAGVLATAGFASYAQPMMGMGMGKGMGDAPCGMQGGGMGQHGGKGMGMRGGMDPAKMEAFMAKRAAELKTKLQITPAQEGAWTAFTAAMKPPAAMYANRPDQAEMAKLTTPERIDKMRVLRAQHMTDMNANKDKRDEAVKALYAALSPEQQKTFDAEHARMGAQRGHGKHGGPGRGPGG